MSTSLPASNSIDYQLTSRHYANHQAATTRKVCQSHQQSSQTGFGTNIKAHQLNAGGASFESKKFQLIFFFQNGRPSVVIAYSIPAGAVDLIYRGEKKERNTRPAAVGLLINWEIPSPRQPGKKRPSKT